MMNSNQRLEQQKAKEAGGLVASPMRKKKEKTKTNAVTMAVGAWGYSTGDAEMDGAESPNNIIERIKQSYQRRLENEVLPAFFTLREIQEGVDLVFDEVDKDAIFEPVVRAADSIEEEFTTISQKLSENEVKRKETQDKIDDLSDAVEDLKLEFSKFATTMELVTNSVVSKEDLGATDVAIEKLLKAINKEHMDNFTNLQDLNSSAGEKSAQIMSKMEETDAQLKEMTADFKEGKKVFSEDLARQRESNEKISALTQEVSVRYTALCEEISKIRRNL